MRIRGAFDKSTVSDGPPLADCSILAPIWPRRMSAIATHFARLHFLTPPSAVGTLFY